jgi:hypothetical protein
MKSPRNAGPVMMLVAALTVTIAVVPRASGQLSLASMASPSAGDSDGSASTFTRKGCKFGQRYSSYYRRCVLWMPFDYT